MRLWGVKTQIQKRKTKNQGKQECPPHRFSSTTRQLRQRRRGESKRCRCCRRSGLVRVRFCRRCFRGPAARWQRSRRDRWRACLGRRRWSFRSFCRCRRWRRRRCMTFTRRSSSTRARPDRRCRRLR